MITFKNILFPINLDSQNLSYVIKTVEIAIGFGGRLHFLYVNDEQAGYRHPTDREDDVALKVKELVPADLIEKLKPVYAISKGKLAEEIEVYCKKEAIDLIIVGHKHRSRFYGALFDSPDVNIIDAIKLPILIIPRN